MLRVGHHCLHQLPSERIKQSTANLAHQNLLPVMCFPINHTREDFFLGAGNRTNNPLRRRKKQRPNKISRSTTFPVPLFSLRDSCPSIVLRASPRLLIRASRSDQENINDPVTYTVRTLTLYKYPTEPNVRMAFPEEITFSTAGNGGLCGVTLEIGSEYLIGLTLSDEDELTANSCDLYRGWSTLTDEELSLLEAGCGEDGGEEEDPCEGACTEFQVGERETPARTYTRC